MTDLRKAAEQALEALEHFNQGNSLAVVQGEFDDEIETLRHALAQPEQEPECVATIGNWGKVQWREDVFPQLGAKLYSAPPKREWVGLTDDELEDLEFASVDREYGHLDIRVLSQAIEQQLKEKNGG